MRIRHGDFLDLHLAGVDLSLHLVDAHLAMQAREVEQFKLRAGGRAGGQRPANGNGLTGGNPGIAVVGVYQIQIFQFIMACSPKQGFALYAAENFVRFFP